MKSEENLCHQHKGDDLSEKIKWELTSIEKVVYNTLWKVIVQERSRAVAGKPREAV